VIAVTEETEGTEFTNGETESTEKRTEKIGGAAGFQNNIVQGVHTLRPDHGKWKLYRTFQASVTGLDGKPLTPPEEAAPEPATEKPPGPQIPEPSPAPAAPSDPAPKPAAPGEKPPQ